MAFTVNSIMTGIMNNPDVAAVGLAAGYLLKWAMGKRNKNQMGFN